MPPLPDLADEAIFPTFAQLPEAVDESSSSATTAASPPSPSSRPSGQEQKQENGGPWYLLAEIKDDMTITKPTLVLRDRKASPFALVFEGLSRDDLDLRRLGLRKGNAAVVPRAERVPPREEGKRGFVRVEPGRAAEVRAFPTSLERVVEVWGAARLRQQKKAREGKEEERCDACGVEKESLMKCTGCGGVRYCSKPCQVKGWSEDGHKGECKVLKTIYDIWPPGSS